MSRVFAIANQKGGVGKTTTSINLGASLAILEKKILLIDADPQANCTSGLGFELKSIEKSIYDALTDDVEPKDIILQTGTDGLDIVPSHIDLVGAEIELLNVESREYRLKSFISKVRDMYDYIIIDCSPSLGLITVNALTAADAVIIPVQCEYFALAPQHCQDDSGKAQSRFADRRLPPHYVRQPSPSLQSGGGPSAPTFPRNGVQDLDSEEYPSFGGSVLRQAGN